MKNTKERIVLAAERLFAVRGISGVSLRRITTKANVNLAAINYHFGSKQGLILHIVEKRLGAVNRERLHRLDFLEKEGRIPSVPEIVDAFLAPALEFVATAEGKNFVGMMGRLHLEAPPELRKRIYRELHKVLTRFIEVFSKALPHHSRQAVLGRISFMVGAMAHTLIGSENLGALARQLSIPFGRDFLLKDLARFVSAGFEAEAEDVNLKAPLSQKQGSDA